jgi:hypothetical protein
MAFQEAESFESRNNDIVLRLTVDGVVERLIRMTETSPRNVSADSQGQSQGRGEGSTLIVATTFDGAQDTAALSIGGIPATGTRLTERFQLSEDRNRLTYSFSVENDVYLTQPLTGSVTWAYREGLQVLRLECDPESASRFLGDASR